MKWMIEHNSINVFNFLLEKGYMWNNKTYLYSYSPGIIINFLMLARRNQCTFNKYMFEQTLERCRFLICDYLKSININ